MRYILGSRRAVKVTAVSSALEFVDASALLETVDVKSDENSQPEGFEETYRGACTRARKAHALDPTAYAIGIESGIRNVDGHWEDWAIIVLITADGKECFAESRGVTFPTDIVEEARRRGFDRVTAGMVLAERFQAADGDPHSFLTQGATSRGALLREAVIQLLTQGDR